MAEADDGSIANDARLLRRIHPSQIVEDKNSNTFRPSSGAFDDPEMSVDVEDILVNQGLDWHFSLKDHAGFSLVRLRAGAARERGLPVVHRPLEGNTAHCEVRGKKTPGIAKALARASEWVHRESMAA